MPPRRKRTLTVKGWPKPKTGKLYKGRIKNVKKQTTHIKIKVENLDPTQLGRIHEMDLPLPIRPSIYHRTCSFLRACGINADIDGAEIFLDDIVGITIGMRFTKATQDGSQQIKFEKIEDSATPNPPDRGSDEKVNQQQPGQSEIILSSNKFSV